MNVHPISISLVRTMLEGRTAPEPGHLRAQPGLGALAVSKFSAVHVPVARCPRLCPGVRGLPELGPRVRQVGPHCVVKVPAVALLRRKQVLQAAQAQALREPVPKSRDVRLHLLCVRVHGVVVAVAHVVHRVDCRFQQGVEARGPYGPGGLGLGSVL